MSVYNVVQNNDEVTIKFRAANLGSGNEPNAFMTIQYPSQMEIVSKNVPVGSYDEPTNVWTIGELNAGDVYDLFITFKVTDISALPYSVVSVIDGDVIDSNNSNNTKTQTVEHVSDIISATAEDDDNASLSIDVSQNDLSCNYCETEWIITGPSVTNLNILSFDTKTGKGEVRLVDPTVEGSFQYTIACNECGDNQTYSQNTAMVTIPKLFDASNLPSVSGDVSLMENDPDTVDPDLYRHTADGVQTDFDTGKGRINNVVYNTSTGIIEITQKDGTVNSVDISDLLSSGEITGTSFPSSNTLRITQKGGNQTDIDLSNFSQVANQSLSLQGANNQTLRITDDNGDVDGDISPIVITGISVDESAAPTKVITITFADGSTITGSFTDDTASGGGDNWGSQVVQSDNTLSGDGTGGNLLAVNPANNNLVSSFQIVGTNLILGLTTGADLTISQSALRNLINTNTTELTNVSLVGNELRVQDDNQIWTVDLSPLIVTSLAWSAITSKPTLSEDGGNVSGFINLDTGTFSLTAPNDDNYVDGASYASGTLTITRTGALADITVDLSELENKDEYYVLSSQFIGLTDNLGDASQLDRQYLVIPKNGEIVNFSFAFGSLDIADTNDLRVHLYLNQHSSGSPISTVQNIDLGYGDTLADHRVELVFSNLPPVIAGDALRFKITDQAGNDLTASTSTGFFGSVTIKNKYSVSNARPVNAEPV